MSICAPLRSQASHRLFCASVRTARLRCPSQSRYSPSRSFISLPDLSAISGLAGRQQPLQTLTATKTLPYPSHQIYEIIADVPSYSKFLPYCTSSAVTRWSSPDELPDWGRKWPEEAVLAVGMKGVSEKWRSKIYCVPGKIVEAVGGESVTRLTQEEIPHHIMTEEGTTTERQSDILTHLLTRWTVKPIAHETDVTLSIEYRFANPLYSAMAGAFADKVAGLMIEAFEKRVRSVMGDTSRSSSSSGQVRTGSK